VQRLLRVLQERKIDRAAAAYGVAAWLVVQGASIAFPTFGAPAWVLKVLIATAVAGFPLALWITWHVTPAPHRKRGATPPSTSTDIALLVFLGGVILLSVAQIALQLGLMPGLAKPAAAPAAAAGAPSSEIAPPRPSIAVLPFLNMSGDASKDYFSDGISEELLNQLSNAPDLLVAARTSSFAFKGKNEDIRTIARALNVRTVLEGSVREDGQHIRITAELVNAADGYHMWSKTYDRSLSNILEVQDEIARAITASLTHGLLGTPPPGRSQTPVRIDPYAYRAYLEGQAFSARKTDDGDARAIQLFRQVTAAQPEFAPAYAALGRTYIHVAEFHDRPPDVLAAADGALRRALALAPGNLEALSSQLLLALMRWDWKTAEDDARRLQSLNPHSVFTLRGLDFYYGSLGFPEQQSAALREATRLDPLSFVDLNNLAVSYNGRGEFAEAASAANDALALRPDRPLALYALCAAEAGMKRTNDAQNLIARLLALHEQDASRGCAIRLAAATGRTDQAHALADLLATRFPSFVFGETDMGNFYLGAHDFAKALAWFARAYDGRDYGLFAVSYLATTPPAFLREPGWIALMRRPEASAWQAAHDRLAAELAGI